MEKSPLELSRLHAKHLVPRLLHTLDAVHFTSGEIASCSKEISSLFPLSGKLPLLTAHVGPAKKLSSLRIGAVFSGGPAAGGHNVLAGLFDAITGGNLIGFLEGPSGILQGNYKELSSEDINEYRNLGGFDLLGSGRTKIETKEHMQAALLCCNKLQLDGLVIIGGDDSNTTAALLTEFFLSNGSNTKIIGVPKTIDGDLKNAYVPLSFGFDTACKVYSELIGNICKDAKSTRKYTHFIRLMGRSASHVTLECSLTTHPNYTFIGEEICEKKKTLQQIVCDVADLICLRARLGKNYGVILIPEGLIEFIPEVSSLIQELNFALSKIEVPSPHAIVAGLSPNAKKCFDSLPESIQKQLLFRRDPHGNVQVSLIETEKLLVDLVIKELEKRKELGTFTGEFHPMTHFLGYEGRCATPSPFDATYCYTLGLTAALLIHAGASGYMAFVSNLSGPIESWEVGGAPLSSLLHMEMRKGTPKPVIQKALVSCQSKAFLQLDTNREKWAVEDQYLSPGPMQFTEQIFIPTTLALEKAKSLLN